MDAVTLARAAIIGAARGLKEHMRVDLLVRWIEGDTSRACDPYSMDWYSGWYLASRWLSPALIVSALLFVVDDMRYLPLFLIAPAYWALMTAAIWLLRKRSLIS